MTGMIPEFRQTPINRPSPLCPPPLCPSAHPTIHYIPVRDIRVATVRFQHAPSDKAYNLGRVRHFVTEAAGRGVEIIAFPEMCLTGYWHVRKLSREAFEALAEPVDGPGTHGRPLLSREPAMPGGAGLLERAPTEGGRGRGRVY